MGVIGGADKCIWESEKEREERLKREKEKIEKEIIFGKMTEEEKRELREKRKNEILTSDDPELDEIGYINICFEAVAWDYFPPNVDVKCTKRRALLFIEGYIKPEEFQEYIDALKEAGYALNEKGIAYTHDDYFNELVHRKQEERAMHGDMEKQGIEVNHGDKERQTVTPEDIAKQTKDMPEGKINPIAQWLKEKVDKFLGR